MKKKPKRKSKFKVPQKHKVKLQKLPKLVDTSKSVQERKERILEGELKSIRPFRQLGEVSNQEIELLNELDSQYFKIMNNFYNSIVPTNLKVDKNYRILRIFRTIGQSDIFGIDASTDDVMFSFLGAKNIITPNYIFEIVCSLESAIENISNLSKILLPEDLTTPFTVKSLNESKAKFYVLVEEEPSLEFKNKDELIINFSDDKFLNSIEAPFDDKEQIKKSIGPNPITIKVINNINNPKAFFYYLQLKHVMRKIDQFGVIGM